jgi:large subunit ribosomal protein L13
VRGMLPHNTLGAAMYRRLKVYAGPTHPHQGQTPRNLEDAFQPATRHAVASGQ